MTIESATFISDLVVTNPGSNDLKSEGDDHVRLVKTTLKATFPNVTGAVTLTHTQLNAIGTGGSPTFADLTATGNVNLAGVGKVVNALGPLTASTGGVTPLTLTNSALNSASTSGFTNLVMGDASSSVPMLQRSKQTVNTASAVINCENGFNTAAKVAEFNYSQTNFYSTGANCLRIDSGGNFTPVTTGTYSAGSPALRWSVVCSVGGNFSGTVTAAAFSGALSGNISQFANDAGYATSAGTVAAAGTLTGSSLAANVVNSSLTSIAPSATDGTYELGFKGLPAASITTGSFVASDRGKCIYATAGVTVPNSTMGTGDVVSIVNTTASPITLTAGIGTLRQAGTANVGSRTLAAFGIASVLFQSSTIAYVSGVGLT